ncbi:hypothetical protein [Shinella sp.]|uniref:hypothetical protein n=1 Tax=Shinella sp. TaxID=1870904 RepID=UPI0029A86C25|nr:hypothetical protein [Shinella sp.]MDX3973308.1 hypothetical protein [Shinella sp.]
MAFKIHDWIMDTSNTTGTDDFLLAGPVLTWRGYDDVLADGDTTYYSASFEGERETGLGTYDADTNTLQRTAIFESTNGGAKVSFSAGTKIVVCAPPSSQMLTRQKGGFEAHKATSQSIAAGATAKIVYPTVDLNDGGIYSSANSRVTPLAGQSLLLKGGIQVALNTGIYVSLSLYKNGSEYRSEKSPDSSGIVADMSLSLIEPVLGNGTDYYEFFGSFAGSGSISLGTSQAKSYIKGVEF